MPDGGAALIAAERQRQIDVEGYTPEHDADPWAHTYLDALARAAVVYATPPHHRVTWASDVPVYWPFDRESWKPTPDDRVRELIKAGALIAAEIDRLRASAVSGEPT